jgi:hypothetical protein
MTGRALFNEVFIDEARAADANIIGGLNNGWAVANTTLMFERASLGSAGRQPASAVPGPKGRVLDRPAGDFATRPPSDGGVPGLGSDLWWRLVEMARKNGRIETDVLRDDLIRLWSVIEINRLSIQRAKDPNQRTGAEPNIGKLVIGPDGMLSGRSDAQSGGMVGAVALFSPGPSIYGGTDEIQRNIIGERILGLPKEPGPDKNTPFKDLPKNS